MKKIFGVAVIILVTATQVFAECKTIEDFQFLYDNLHLSCYEKKIDTDKGIYGSDFAAYLEEIPEHLEEKLALYKKYCHGSPKGVDRELIYRNVKNKE